MQQNFAGFFKSLTILFYALLGGQILFMVAALVLNRYEPPVDDNPDPMMVYYGLGFAACCVVLSFIVYPRLLAKAQRAATLPEKIQQYRTASIARWAMIEAGALGCLGFYLLNPKQELLLLAALTTSWFFMTRPTQARLFGELSLTATEQATLGDPNFVVAEVSAE